MNRLYGNGRTAAPGSPLISMTPKAWQRHLLEKAALIKRTFQHNSSRGIINRSFDSDSMETSEFGEQNTEMQPLFKPSPKRKHRGSASVSSVSWSQSDAGKSKSSKSAATVSSAQSKKLSDPGSAVDYCTTEELREYRDIFYMFDRDKNGSIGVAELGIAMQSLGMDTTDSNLEALIREVDADGNGEIDFDEFCLVLKKMCSKRQPTTEELAMQCFEVFDTDGDGYICEFEFSRVLRELGGFDDEEQINEIFKEFDILCNGHVNFEEFKQVFKMYWYGDDEAVPSVAGSHQSDVLL